MSNIDYSKLRSLTARHIIRALEKDGFVLERQRGSHQQYRHSDGRQVTVSFHHLSDTYTLKILRSMLEIQARWTKEDIERLKLIEL